MRIRVFLHRAGGRKRGVAGFARNALGTAATEFAVVLPFFGMLFVGAFEFSKGFALQVDLEQAAQRAVELAVARPRPVANTTTELAHIRSEAETAAGYAANSPNVTVELYRECDDYNTATNDRVGTYVHATPCASGTRQIDYVRVEVRGTYTRWMDWRTFRNQTSTATPYIVGQATARVG